MISRTEKVESRLFHILKAHGFKRKGRYLFQIINDVIAIFAFESVRGYTHLYFTIMPLYLPGAKHIYLTYGNRLDYLYKDLQPVCYETSGDDMERWFKCAEEHLLCDLFPVIKQISRAETLHTYLAKKIEGKNCNVHRDLLCCGIDHLLKLYCYTSLYINNRESALIAAKQYIHVLRTQVPYTPLIVERETAEMQKTIMLIELNQSLEIEKLFSSARKATLECVIGNT